MKDIFRFWGFPKSVFEILVGPGKPIELHLASALQTRFGRIVFSGEAAQLLDNFGKEIQDGLFSYLQISSDITPTGKTIARLEQESGEAFPLVTIDNAGKFHFYFDPDQTIEFIQQEKYVDRKPPIYVRLGIDPDGLPGFVRKTAMLSFNLSRTLLSNKSRPAYPKPFKDFSVDVWRFLVKALIDNAGGQKFPAVPLWPDGKRFVAFLNHDVDTAWGFRNENGIEAFRKIEEAKNLRSLWLIVAKIAGTEHGAIQKLFDAGHEIGCHGIRHDHQTAYLPENKIRERLMEASSFLRDFNCAGFRSPSYHHTPALFRALNAFVHYDLSVHDTFENVNSPVPASEGCSTCFPYKIEETNLFEFPTNVAEDFVLEMHGFSPERVLKFQLEMIEKIKKRGGAANILTHPEPQLSGREKWITNYKLLLDELTKDSSAWIPLPRDLCRWWKEREEKINLTWQ